MAWLLCVEYVHDLTREPYLGFLLPLRHLPDLLRRACQALAHHARERHAVAYEQVADHVEALLELDLGRMTAHDLGRIDAFRYEMALDLMEGLQEPGTRIHLTARLPPSRRSG